jgi:hypothetical protein
VYHQLLILNPSRISTWKENGASLAKEIPRGKDEFCATLRQTKGKARALQSRYSRLPYNFILLERGL